MKRFFGFAALVLTVFAFTFISCEVEADNSSPTVNTVAVTGLSLDKTTAQTVNVGESISFTATVSPDNATDKTVKWSVSGTGVTLYSDSACSTAITTDTAISTLTVYAKGTAAGNATVTVTSNADSTKTASCAVTVGGSVATSPLILTGGYFAHVDVMTMTEDGPMLELEKVSGNYSFTIEFNNNDTWGDMVDKYDWIYTWDTSLVPSGKIINFSYTTDKGDIAAELKHHDISGDYYNLVDINSKVADLAADKYFLENWESR